MLFRDPLPPIREALGLRSNATLATILQAIGALSTVVRDAENTIGARYREHIDEKIDTLTALAEAVTRLPNCSHCERGTSVAFKIAAGILASKGGPVGGGDAGVTIDESGTIGVTHWAARVFAVSLRRSLSETKGADNYLEMTFNDPKGQIIVNVRRWNGKTPATLRAEAAAERDEARAEVVRLSGEVSMLRAEVDRLRAPALPLSGADPRVESVAITCSTTHTAG